MEIDQPLRLFGVNPINQCLLIKEGGKKGFITTPVGPDASLPTRLGFRCSYGGILNRRCHLQVRLVRSGRTFEEEAKTLSLPQQV